MQYRDNKYNQSTDNLVAPQHGAENDGWPVHDREVSFPPSVHLTIAAAVMLTFIAIAGAFVAASIFAGGAQ